MAVQAQSPTVARTATPTKETAPEPTGYPRTAPATTPGPTGAEAATPTISKAPEFAATPTPEATDDPPVRAITPLMPDDAETFASELSESELACLAGTADIGRLSRIFSGLDETPPEELTEIIGCLQEDTLLRMFLSGVVQDPAPLSMETSACIRTAFEGIDLRSGMLAAMLGNGQNNMIAAGVFVTIACLNDVEVEELDYLQVKAGKHKPTPQTPVYGSCEEAEATGEERVQGSKGGEGGSQRRWSRVLETETGMG